MKTAIPLLISLTLLLICYAHGRRGPQRPQRLQKAHPLRQKPTDPTPSCVYSADENEIQCYYLSGDSADLLRQSLELTSEFVQGFGVYIDESDGPSLPVDIFTGYNVTKLLLYDTRFTAIPYELLSNIDGPLAVLDIMDQNFSSAATTATDLFLPFAESLTELQFGVTMIPRYDPGTFSQYTNLKTLYLNTNPVTSIGLELLDMFNLENIDYWYNDISTIETGAFRDLRSLRTMSLDYNNFTTLQEGAFDGLENSPIVAITLSYNPWNCDCDLQWLKDWLNARNISDASGAQCAPPKNGTFNEVTFC